MVRFFTQRFIGLIVIILLVLSSAQGQNQCQELFLKINHQQAAVAVEPASQRYQNIREYFSALAKNSEQLQFLDQFLWGFKEDVEKANGDLQKAGFLLDEKTLSNSAEMPIPIWTEQGTLGKSLVLWRGQLYLEGHFRSMAFSPEYRSANRKTAIENTIKHQLWGLWNPELRRFEFKTTGVQTKLLQNFYDGKVYRGMRDFEFKMLQALAHLYRSDLGVKKSVVVDSLQYYLDKVNLSEGDRSQLQGFLSHIKKTALNREDATRLADTILVMVYADQSTNRVLPLFTSPSKAIGKKWAKPDMAQFNLSREELIQLSEKGELFVGVEDVSLEIGFYSLQSWKTLIHSLVLTE